MACSESDECTFEEKSDREKTVGERKKHDKRREGREFWTAYSEAQRVSL